MSPSFVRSKRAPHSSSSRTRSGASCACSCAMRQLFRSFPPRMVSRKWTFQLSSGHTLPSAAAMPPSAITVCALPRSDLHTIAVFAPRTCLDRGAQPGATRADDHHVVLVALDVAQSLAFGEETRSRLVDSLLTAKPL